MKKNRMLTVLLCLSLVLVAMPVCAQRKATEGTVHSYLKALTTYTVALLMWGKISETRTHTPAFIAAFLPLPIAAMLMPYYVENEL